jgi:hypothetical protein
MKPPIKKICSYCKENKLLNDFSNHKGHPDKKDSRCKSCSKIIKKIDYEKNHQKRLLSQKKYRKENSEKVKNAINLWRKNNPEKVNAYRPNWIKNNSIKMKEIIKQANSKFRSTLKGKLIRNFTTAIWKSLKSNKNNIAWENLVGYNLLHLQNHLEKQFQPGMTWGNYGLWHVDHKIPLAVFNFTKPTDVDFKRCWMLSNLQPLWAKENTSKKNKLAEPFQPSLLL